MQKSREGLLRHLLHSALLSLPADSLNFAKGVCGLRWLPTHRRRAWSYGELYDMLVRLVSYSEAKFFFLVDALDECDPQDCHRELAIEMLKISRLPNVKLCVSCRRWKPFVTTFGQSRILCLDQMTYKDIKRYICNRLANADDENDLCSEFQPANRTERAMIFVAGLAKAAQGVFLWTELVIKALSSEIRKGCGFESLENVFSEFPIGLDEYYQKLVFDRITRTRQNTSDTAAALMLALKTTSHEQDWDSLPGSTSFLNFWLLGTGRLAAGFAWTDHNGNHYTREDTEQMVTFTISFIQVTCKDLLVVVKRDHDENYDGTTWDVEFLHRTASDFLYDNHVRLLIEQQAPKHFNDASFLDELERLRCVYLLHITWDSYLSLERKFHLMAKHPREPFPRDMAWLVKCETLMICIHQRRHGAGNCQLNDHGTSYITDFISAGLTNYVLSIMISWPHIALSARDNSHNWSGTVSCVLVALLDEWLRSIFEVPSNNTINGLNTVTNTWPRNSPISNGLANRRRFFFAAFRHSLAYTMSDQRINLLEHLLGWGLNVNARSREHFDGRALLSSCHQSIWQNWLAAAVLKVRPYKRGISNNKRFDGVHITSETAKKSISDIVALLLWCGADPDCAVCIYDHHDGGPCRQVSLESALETITPQDRMDQIQDLRAMQSRRFDRRAIQHRQMRRALRSWTASKHSASMLVEVLSGREFLVGFVQTMIGNVCSDCSASTGVLEFAMALCLDCLSSYQLCVGCIHRRSTDDLTLDYLTKQLVHESSASDGIHASIYIVRHYQGTYSPRAYGEESSISVLEDWYARNTNDEETALD